MAHPVHPALVHFPIACWSLATAGDVGQAWLPAPWLPLVGVLHAIGSVSALAAIFAGLFELDKVPRQSAAFACALRHMTCAGGAWLVYSLSLVLRIENGEFLPPGTPAVILSLLGFILLCLTGYFGGALVYRFGIGIDRSDKGA